MAAVAFRTPRVDADGDLRRHFDAMLDGAGFRQVLDCSVVEFDELAQLIGIRVDGVDATDETIAVRYTVSWEAFHACDDLTVRGMHARVARGRIEGADWVFDVMQAPAARDTLDEF